ncbi:MAG: chemotaxis response regulator protein-glutamate methylesterase [Clostridiaceae bacterium]|nr:chemotaxis response regulator protein-glutamate methylesterase [Clostridiaceae bacterium]
MLKNKIKVMVIDDSAFFRQAMRTHIGQDPDLEVVGEAPDADAAIHVIERTQPDVITLDVEMPGMSGIDFLKKVMPKFDIPVVVVSSANNIVFDALSAGAVDFVAKPDAKMGMGYGVFVNDLKIKIKISATANRRAGRAVAKAAATAAPIQTASGTAAKGGSKAVDLIAMGASTGGTEALYEIIKELPVDMPGIVVVQHMPPVFTQMYAQRLNQSCALEVKEAEDHDKVLPGRVLIAPGDFQMRVKKSSDGSYYVRCEKGERVSGHCPSVDVLFDSVAANAGRSAVGVILTGMGADGARGLLAMHQQGAKTIGQNEQSCVVYGMPKVAYELGAVDKQMPVAAIAEEIVRITGR